MFSKFIPPFSPSYFVIPSPAAVGFVSEDEYLEIQGITREQSGDYECSASNDVAAPVVRRVKVTVNCKWSHKPTTVRTGGRLAAVVATTKSWTAESTADSGWETMWYHCLFAALKRNNFKL